VFQSITLGSIPSVKKEPSFNQDGSVTCKPIAL